MEQRNKRGIYGKGIIDSGSFLEDESVMKKKLKRILEIFGAESLPYAGPECGLGGFPSYKTAVNYLQRVAEVVKQF